MAAELILVQEVQQDIDEAYSWYEDCRPGLGEDFLSCLDACIQVICRMPELYAKAHEEYRRALVGDFHMSFFTSIPMERRSSTASFIHPVIQKSGGVAWFDFQIFA
jgi:hypothetical protein